MADFTNAMNELVAKLDDLETSQHKAKGYSHPPAKVYWEDRGRKFAYINIGVCGAWLVEKATGEIFNIKGFGVPDYNKKKKADIGNIATVAPEYMHQRRWNYLR